MNPDKKKRKRDRYKANRIARGLPARAARLTKRVTPPSSPEWVECRECGEQRKTDPCDYCWVDAQNGGECFD